MMKKFITVILLFLLMFSSCAGETETGEPAFIDADPSDVISAIYSTVAETKAFGDYKTMLDNTAVDEQSELYYLGVNGVEYVSAVASEASIQPTPYSFVVIKLKKGTDYDGQRRLIEQNLNKAKWVCMSCEEAIAVRYENFIAVIMCDKQTVNALETAYLSVMEDIKNGSK